MDDVTILTQRQAEATGERVKLFSGAHVIVPVAKPLDAVMAHETRIVQTPDGWQLLRDGQPYFIKGAGGVVRMARAKELGANSVRTWTPTNLQAVLDEAHSLGMTVCAGLFVKKAVSNKDFYSAPGRDAEEKRAQKIGEYVDIVKQFSRHPALLMWAIGNEAQAEGCSAFAPLYTFINNAAKAVRQADPHHVICTVTTSPTEDIAASMNAHCPDVDVWGINVYGPLLPKLPTKMREVGWQRCYCVTEYGPKNHWQSKKTAWDAKLEPTSSEKAVMYKAAYEAIASDKALCCGGYAFKWGGKVQVTPTWICLLNEYKYTLIANGGSMQGFEETAAVVELAACWSGKPATQHAPRVTAILLAGQAPDASVTVQCSHPVAAECQAAHLGIPLSYLWMVLPELGSKANTEGVSWSSEDVAPIPGCISDADKEGHVTVTPPSAPGNYRLYVWVSDGRGFMGTANIPFQATAAGGGQHHKHREAEGEPHRDRCCAWAF